MRSNIDIIGEGDENIRAQNQKSHRSSRFALNQQEKIKDLKGKLKCMGNLE
ncbi:hypothetical protein [Cyclobacterium sp.]|uniref:hypothetical protein n=1 Tax=Cyclobacterium sp. TaxID=1966343 RepID=UPI0019B0EEF2|nr:hypothetical protein [Cyclobacterium sp.]MBD3627469.1 hypothetical protein [Cyclobacterium sp.]